MITNIAWVLPRPSKSRYIGSFPLHFESRLLDLLRVPSGALILHPFGGKAEYGIRLDTNAEVKPDILADAHYLPFNHGVFDVVILDPPYSDDLSKRLYSSGPIIFKRYTSEAVRVTKEDGYIVLFHVIATPAIRGTRLIKRIFVEHRLWHGLRCVHIHKKDSYAWMGKRGQNEMRWNGKEFTECQETK